MLRVSVYSVDHFGRVDIKGYGACRLPTRSGTQTRHIQCFRPVICSEQQGWAERLGTRFLDGAPRYADEQCVLSGDSRYAHLTQSTGSVELQITVIHAGFETHSVLFDPMNPDAAQQSTQSSMCFDCHTTKPLTVQQAETQQALYEEMVRAKTRQLIQEAEQEETQRQQRIDDELRRADEEQQQQQEHLTSDDQQQQQLQSQANG